MKRTAFSLVELSIVLVILGLLVGGILAGQSLIRASELRAIQSEYQGFVVAVNTFRDKYFAVPGDMVGPSVYLHTPGNVPLQNYTGDGNGRIEHNNASSEAYLFWVELKRAGLIERMDEPYFAVSGPSTPGPSSKLSGAAWGATYLGSVAVDGTTNITPGYLTPDPTIFYAGAYENVFVFGAGNAYINTFNPPGILRTEEAWNIDTKMDDGKPDAGALRTLESQGSAAGSGCGNQDGATSAIAASNYALTNTSATACSLVFRFTR